MTMQTGVSTPDRGAEYAVEAENLFHRYGGVSALDGVSLRIRTGETVGVVGADGTGKSTLLSLIAGIRTLQEGRILTLGRDVSCEGQRNRLFSDVAIMPQGLGRNLYPTLSVEENLAFHASLFGLSAETRRTRMRTLLSATSLTAFAGRAAGKLSGGMKQKLSLCCALVHRPKLLILDEPTTGVDPLSRRQFWRMLRLMREADPLMTMIVSTAYIDEAEGFERIVVMDGGKIVSDMPTGEMIASFEASSLEEAYMKALPESRRGRVQGFDIPPLEIGQSEEPVIETRDLTRTFGSFTAVDRVSFRIRRGEIFGFLGSNGCGKSTTMKMLTGLLEPTSGEGSILGVPLGRADADMRRHVGYMSQAFSLYEELTVRANLSLHGQLYQTDDISGRIRRALETFDLLEVADAHPSELSLGVRQRLQLAAACLHDPEILILDEPTSGVDPAARDMFWDHLIRLSRKRRVTIFVSTHFMNEAMRCDRISLMHRGRVLAAGTPTELVRQSGCGSLEETFISYLEQQQGATEEIPEDAFDVRRDHEEEGRSSSGGGMLGGLALILTFAFREMRELLRDPVRMFFALFGAVILEMTAVHGISFDLTPMPFMVADHDNSKESREYADHFRGSPYLKEIPVAEDQRGQDAGELLSRNRARLLVDIPQGFGRDLLKGHQPEVSFYADGVFPSVNGNLSSYVMGINAQYARDLAERTKGASSSSATGASYSLEPRFQYNETFDSISVMTPGLIMIAVVLFPGMMTALGVVREKELGTIANLYSSPAAVTEYLVGKQLPYVAISFASFLILTSLAVLALDVPVKGSFAALCLGAVLAASASASFGLLVSCFVRSQIAAVFGTAVLSIVPSINFSGFLFPVSSLETAQQILGRTFPGCWFQLISLGSFTKGLSASSFTMAYGALALEIFAYLLLASLLLKKQEK
ncbi:MAG: ribosome-associated ATPase/putative transporter RbbA [Succinivibrionaceae bacterium]|nr:ribosome-associated ATPase/putative transporter RbbA [Succinivibrionaceae bacterium]